MRPRKDGNRPAELRRDGQWHERHSNRMLETAHTFEDLVRACSGAGT
jgi:hypothetical protein